MDIETELNGGVYTVRFNRAHKKNAITQAMYQALADALATASADDAVRVVVIAGSETIFTAGNDLEDFIKAPTGGSEAPVFQFLHRLSAFEKPVIAAVRGAAIGIGTTLLLHCDVVYAAEDARFKLPFTSLGLVPEAGSSWLLPHLAGYQRAAEMLLFGDEVSAQQAAAMGLVNRLLEPQGLMAFVAERAATLAALPAASVRATKALMKKELLSPVRQRMDDEAALFSERLRSPEAKEAFAAFFERRKPDFSRFN